MCRAVDRLGLDALAAVPRAAHSSGAEAQQPAPTNVPRQVSKTATSHNARHQARPGFSMPSRECAHVRGSVIAKSGGFPGESSQGGGLKNRCGFERKSQIPQVSISRTLSVCGEVAERLKAAVC